MSTLLDQLLSLLELERIEINLFRGKNWDIGSKNVFGGQVLGQALVAAGNTVEGRNVHSLHGYFLRPGDKQVPIVYEVDRIRDGGSFTTRRVVAIQHGKAIFSMSASFQKAEEGVHHQIDMPPVPGPDNLASEREARLAIAHHLPEDQREFFIKERPIEMRPVTPDDLLSNEKKAPHQMFWLRANGKLNDDVPLHQALLAYTSDFYFMGTAMRPHGLTFATPGMQAASLDHAMWFHGEFRMDDWLLYVMESPASSHGRGLNLGRIYRADGVLVASCAQEGLMRLHKDKK